MNASTVLPSSLLVGAVKVRIRHYIYATCHIRRSSSSAKIGVTTLSHWLPVPCVTALTALTLFSEVKPLGCSGPKQDLISDTCARMHSHTVGDSEVSGRFKPCRKKQERDGNNK